jgi:chromosome segregation ATPase
VICSVDDTTWRGRAVTLRAGVDPAAVARAVRQGEATDGDTTIRVRARRPNAVHERVGCVRPEMGLRIRTALAEAARVRGCRTHLDSEIRACRDRLADRERPDVQTADERERLATARGKTDRLREEVAEMRGRLTARREAEGAGEAAAEQFRDAARELSEAETTAAATRQRLARQRREARTARDHLEQRFALEDELANLRRDARRRLVAQVRPAYESAVAAVPGSPADPDPFDVDPVTGALAVARVADFDAPVVLDCDRFEDAGAASAWLGAPVIRLASV